MTSPMDKGVRGDVGTESVSSRRKTTRVMRWRAARTTTKWRSRGWDLAYHSQGRVRTTLVFERPRRNRKHHQWMAAVFILAVVLAVGGWAALRLTDLQVSPGS